VPSNQTAGTLPRGNKGLPRIDRLRGHSSWCWSHWQDSICPPKSFKGSSNALGFHQMFDQVPHEPLYDKDPNSDAQVCVSHTIFELVLTSLEVRDCKTMLNRITKEASVWQNVNFAINPMLEWPIGTPPASKPGPTRRSTHNSRHSSTYGPPSSHLQNHAMSSIRVKTAGSSLVPATRCQT
jgi:hypothetical protein